MNNDVLIAKKAVAKSALDLIEDNMIIGFGSGSTVSIFIEELKNMLKEKELKIYGVSSSIDTSLQLAKSNISVLDPLTVDRIDLAIDGADSVLLDKGILIKGGGGAFVMEKIIDYWANELVILVDETKIDKQHPIPIEIIPKAVRYVEKVIESMFGTNVFKLRECKGKLRPCISDNGNIIADLHLDMDEITAEKEFQLNKIPGVIDNGIFKRKTIVKVGEKTGKVKEIRL